MSCGKTVKGRSDKKFCDDYCRNDFNNRLRAADSHCMRRIQQHLRKNRNILRGLLPDEKNDAEVHRDNLLVLGFRFDFVTHIQKAESGYHYFFCYDYGYTEVNLQQYLIVRGTAAGEMRS